MAFSALAIAKALGLASVAQAWRDEHASRIRPLLAWSMSAPVNAALTFLLVRTLHTRLIFGPGTVDPILSVSYSVMSSFYLSSIRRHQLTSSSDRVLPECGI